MRLLDPDVGAFVAIEVHGFRGAGVFFDLFDFEFRLGWISLYMSQASLWSTLRRVLKHIGQVRDDEALGIGA